MPSEDTFLVVWSTAGTPLWVGAVSSNAAGTSASVLQWDLKVLGSLVAGMAALFGQTRLSRLLLSCPVVTGAAIPVEVLACRGVLCMVGAVTPRLCSSAPLDGHTPMANRPLASCLGHPLSPLLFLALSLLEPACREETDQLEEHAAAASSTAAVPNPFAAKTTPTNSLCLEANTPGAPTKALPPPEGSDPAADVAPTRRSAPRARWRAVTHSLIDAAALDEAMRRQGEAMSGKELLKEQSVGRSLGECLQSREALEGCVAEELIDTMSELLAWWCRHHSDLSGRSIWVILSSVDRQGLRVDEVHPTPTKRLYCPAVHRWLRADIPSAVDGPGFLKPSAVHQECLKPICMPVPVPAQAPRAVDDVSCIAVVRGASCVPSTISVVLSHWKACDLTPIIDEWNGLSAMATTAF